MGPKINQLEFNSQENAKMQSIDNINFLFKGAKIKNTDWVLGLVLYTGTDTKIQQNGTNAKNKISHLEKRIHITILILFIF